MQFMLLCCFSERRWQGLAEVQRQEIMQKYGEFERDIAPLPRDHEVATGFDCDDVA